MRHLALTVLTTFSCALAAPIQFRAADGLTVYGEHVAVPSPRGAVLLFHASGRNWHEYDAIGKRLAREGYASLAVDQRFATDYDGFRSRTVQGLGNRLLDVEGMLADMDAAHAWLKRTYPNARLFALGSGFSASLLFPFASRHADLAGILAFSPNKGSLENFALGRLRPDDVDLLTVAKRVRVPVFLTSSEDPAEIAAVRELLPVVASTRRTQFVPSIPPGYGAHGAINLDPAKTTNAAVSEMYWKAVLAFLRQP